MGYHVLISCVIKAGNSTPALSSVISTDTLLPGCLVLVSQEGRREGGGGEEVNKKEGAQTRHGKKKTRTDHKK